MPNPMATDLRKLWGDALRLERHRQRLKQSDVAVKAGVSQPTVSSAEKGQAPLEACLAIGEALGLNLLGES